MLNLLMIGKKMGNGMIFLSNRTLKLPVLTYLKMSHDFDPWKGDRQAQFQRKYNCTVIGGGQSVSDDVVLLFDSDQEILWFALRHL